MSNSGNRRGGSQSDVDTSRAISNQKKYHYPTIAELVGSEASLDSVCSNLKKGGRALFIEGSHNTTPRKKRYV